jgi:hypothetical protein
MDIVARQAMFAESDPLVFRALSDLERALAAAAASAGGTIVHGGPFVFIAAFARAEDACRAGLALLASEVMAVERARLAVHEGKVLSVRRASGIGYFGETVEQLVALLPEAAQRTMVLSHVIEGDAAALQRMHSLGARVEVIKVGPQERPRRALLVSPA